MRRAAPAPWLTGQASRCPPSVPRAAPRPLILELLDIVAFAIFVNLTPKSLFISEAFLHSTLANLSTKVAYQVEMKRKVCTPTVMWCCARASLLSMLIVAGGRAAVKVGADR